MKPSNKAAPKPVSGEQQVRGLISRFEPKRQALFRSLRKAMQKRFPTANELVYDYPNSLVISYSPTDRGIESVVAIASGSDGVRLYLNAKLPDPNKILHGSGKQVRFIQIESPGTLRLQGVETLLETATVRAKPPLSPGGRGMLILKSTSTNKRPSRKSKR